MFIGQYEHRLEEKGRLSIPKKFRSQLAAGCVISLGLDGCLFLYPLSAWNKLINKLSQLPLTKSDARAFSRSLTYQAYEVDIDRLGRILIPDYLRQFAKLKNTVIVAGAIERIEIWDQDRYSNYSQKINQDAEKLAEQLDIS